MDLYFFDPRESVAVLDRRLPHWSQAGVLCFITFRTHDSMPRNVVKAWLDDRVAWLLSHGIAVTPSNCGEVIRQLDPELQHRFHAEFSSRWHDQLDTCHGACVLQDPEYSTIVADSFHRFDRQRYLLTDFVVMPNHVHVLAAFFDDDSMLSTCESWKRFTGRRINQRLKVSGRFWQQDGFDHLIRSEQQFHRIRQYIADNPAKARLKVGEYLHFSCED